ncbi:hypothetical protein FE783_11530 [Paenibacillus mesophilus]|nr:hypothetical protein FE783_11530 [Paenibacillus mesophilus]
MNERIKRVGVEQTAREKQTAADWTKEIELLEARLRELRKAGLTVEGQGSKGPPDHGKQPSANAGMGRSLLESLAYAQSLPIRHERPKRPGRKSWRPEVFETTLGSDPMPDSSWKSREDRGES